MEIKGIKYTAPVFDGCYDKKTEVLTDNGWKFFKDVTYEDNMATVNLNGQLEYNVPEQLIVDDWDGEMYKFYSRIAKIDLLVTPNHNMYVQTENFYRKFKLCNWKFETAEKIFGKPRYFKKDVEYIKEDLEYVTISNKYIYNGIEETYNRTIKTDDWLEFLGYYLSEGSITITYPKKNYIIQIRQFGKHIDKMAKALSRITIGSTNSRKNDGRILVSDKELARYLKREFGDKYNKNIPRYLLNNCSKRQLKILFEALMLGDGHDQRGSEVDGGSSYSTASLQLRDDFLELLFKIGYSGSYVRTRKKGEKITIYNRVCICRADNWNIYIKFESNYPFKSKQTNFNERRVNYKGKIYCVTVKNHTLYVRRNGCSVWCGNSGYAKAARGNIMALHKLGIQLTINPVSFEKAKPDLGEEGKILSSLVNRDIDYNVNFIHLTPEFYEDHKELGKINCGYTVWENSKLHKSWPAFINNNLDKVITGSEWGANIFKESGITIPVGVCSHCVSVKEFKNIGSYQINGVSDDTFVFYDIFQFVEKKSPLDAIKTYWATFQNNEDVALVLKTYRSDFSEGEKDAIRRTAQRIKGQMQMEKYPPVYLILDMLSDEQIVALHNRGDCLISLNKGEGVGLVPLQAGAHGNPIIITGWGGSLEYAKPNLAYLVNHTLEPVFGMNYSPWHSGDQWWAKADLKHASELMLYVYHNKDEARKRGLKLQEYIGDNFSYEAIGKKLIEEIEML